MGSLRVGPQKMRKVTGAIATVATGAPLLQGGHEDPLPHRLHRRGVEERHRPDDPRADTRPRSSITISITTVPSTFFTNASLG